MHACSLSPPVSTAATSRACLSAKCRYTDGAVTPRPGDVGDGDVGVSVRGEQSARERGELALAVCRPDTPRGGLLGHGEPTIAQNSWHQKTLTTGYSQISYSALVWVRYHPLFV